MGENMENIEELKKGLTKERVTFDNKIFEGITPLVLISLDKEGKINIKLNSWKFYNILAMENKLEQSLDITLVDFLLELLESLAKGEDDIK